MYIIPHHAIAVKIVQHKTRKNKSFERLRDIFSFYLHICI